MEQDYVLRWLRRHGTLPMPDAVSCSHDHYYPVEWMACLFERLGLHIAWRGFEGFEFPPHGIVRHSEMYNSASQAARRCWEVRRLGPRLPVYGGDPHYLGTGRPCAREAIQILDWLQVPRTSSIDALHAVVDLGTLHEAAYLECRNMRIL